MILEMFSVGLLAVAVAIAPLVQAAVPTWGQVRIKFPG